MIHTEISEADEMLTVQPMFANYVVQAASGQSFTIFYPYVIITRSLQDLVKNLKNSQTRGTFSDIKIYYHEY